MTGIEVQCRGRAKVLWDEGSDAGDKHSASENYIDQSLILFPQGDYQTHVGFN